MKKRQLTEEQTAARDARRDKFRAITKAVGAMTDEQRAQLVPHFGAVPTCEGRVLSLKNTMLAVMQMPGVSMVGGFRQWIRTGRVVKKGEHGLMIWIPLGKSHDGESGGEEGESQRFGTTTVFDISQTCELEPGEKPETETPAVESAAVVLVPVKIEAPVRREETPAQFELISADVEISSAITVK